MNNNNDTHRNEDTDAQTVKEVMQGDENAFERLVKKYQQPVFNIVYRYVGNYDDAEEVAQEVFMKVWHHAKGFKGKSKFSTWLFRIAVNQCLDHRHKNKRPVESLDNIIQKEITPESLKYERNAELESKRKIVRKAIDELPERQRMALVLSKFEEKPYKEIAQIMGTSLSSVESLIFRAKGNLKKKLLPLKENGKIKPRICKDALLC
ncbi:MAG TPA: sigma-70 family RNA polymerase sigma factor [bacterium]